MEVRLKLGMTVMLVFLYAFHQNLSLCWCLNIEGLALLRFKERVIKDPYGALSSWNYSDEDLDHCFWFGVECSDGDVVALNLRDLCLGGTLTHELGKLTHIKSIILRNNSFSGSIPKEIGKLKELEVLDLGYNNFTGAFPGDLISNLSLSILLLDNNKYISSIPLEIYNLKLLSESQVHEKQLTGDASSTFSRWSGIWNAMRLGDIRRSLLQRAGSRTSKVERNRLEGGDSLMPSFLSPAPSASPGSPVSSISVPPSTSVSSPSESPSPSASDHLTPSPSPMLSQSPAPSLVESPPVFPIPLQPPPITLPSPAPGPSQAVENTTKSNHHKIFVISGVVGGFLFMSVAILGAVYCQKSRVITVKPWATGLSGQLQKAFVTGVPKLQRSELETACEDFSNIIGTLSDVTVYKGTLSSGVEIAVTSTAVKSAVDWSGNLEAQFRKKIETLSNMNHKNFVNLIGYCEEENPFTRMMVFEYTPNGTLFEHLHIKESEHLDWAMRLRIAMGMAYCLEYMHQLNPPVTHKNLQSSAVYLTEDYAAKISDFSFYNEVVAAKMCSATMEFLETLPADPESNVYSFGVILFEMITGKLPYYVDSGSHGAWAADYMREDKPLTEMVDQTLESFKEDELMKLFGVIKDCVLADPKERPTMKQITARLKEITAMEPDAATPKLSPLWWAELEILSTES